MSEVVFLICPTDVTGRLRLADFGSSRWLSEDANIPYECSTDIQVSFTAMLTELMTWRRYCL